MSDNDDLELGNINTSHNEFSQHEDAINQDIFEETTDAQSQSSFSQNEGEDYNPYASLSYDDEDEDSDEVADDRPNRDTLFFSEKEEQQPTYEPKTKTNDATFFNRSRIFLVLFGLLSLIIIIVFFIIPILQGDKKEKEDELGQRGASYIPELNFKPDAVEEIIQAPFPTTQEDIPASDDEILATIPYADESKENIAPVTAPSSSSAASARPETFNNEQQKTMQRLSVNGGQGSIGQNTSQGLNSYNSSNASAYQDYASDRINSLMNTASAFGSGQNTYTTQNNQSDKQSFDSMNARSIGMQLNSEFSLYNGTVISAALTTGINTDLPGDIIARVTKNIYSSLDGRYLLIPSGSILIGSYNSNISYGQSRVQVAWNKLIRTDGLEINLGNMVGIDKKGYAGYSGLVNQHPIEYLKAMGLIAAFSVLDTKIDNTVNAQENMYAQNAIASTYETINKVGAKIIDRTLDIQPTIIIPQGKEINIITNISFDLPPVEEHGVYQKYVRD